MKNLSIILFLLLLSITIVQSEVTRAPEDFMGRVSIPYGNEIEVLEFKTDQIVYAGTNGAGLYVSYDGGSNWGKLNAFPEEFPSIKDILITKNKDLYVATFGGGVYYSNDNGASFVAKNSGIKNLFVQALAVTQSGKLLCGTYGGGIYYSDDNGGYWTRTDAGLRYDNVTCITEMNNGFILAGTWGGGFYVSRDTCKTWMVANTLLENKFINDLAKNPAGHVFAATNGSGVMFTADGIQWLIYSNKWHDPYDAFTAPLLDTAVTAVGANKYQLLMGTRSTGMYYWDALWNAWQSTGTYAVGITASTVSPNGTILATRSYGDVVRSTDNGLYWEVCADKIVDIELGQYDKNPWFLNVFTSEYDNSLVSVADYGKMHKLYLSKDNGNTWKYLNSIQSDSLFDIEFLPDGKFYVADKDAVRKYLPDTGTFDIILEKPIKYLIDNKLDTNYCDFREVEYNPVSKTVFVVWQYLDPRVPGSPIIKCRFYKSGANDTTWTYTFYDQIPISNLKCETNGDVYLQIMENFTKSTDNGATFNTKQISWERIIFGQDGNFYYVEKQKKIYVQKNKVGDWLQIPFTPEPFVEDDTWHIESMGCNLDGDLYIAVIYQVLTQGYRYEIFTTSDEGQHWQTLKGCYNMDDVRYFRTDNIGYTYILTNALYKILNPNNLKPPKILTPKDEIMGEEIHPVFAWERAPLAEEYEIQIDQTDLFYTPFETNVTGDTTLKSIIELKYNQEYYWRIRSKTHSARSAWSINSFTTGMEPPFLISPEKGKLGVPLNADLKWHKKEDATHYSIQVAEDENFFAVVYSKDNYTDTVITTNKLLGLKTYYWRVKAFTENNASSWSEVWNFRTVMGPPQLIYPENNSIDKLLSEQFKWYKSLEAQTYYIQVATDTGFSSIFYEGTAGADTFKIIDNMLPETDYYWHVSSVNTEGTSEYSEIWTFRTSFKAVELQTPVNKIVNIPLNAKFTWLEHNGGSQYQIQISKMNDFKTTVVDEKVNNLLEFQTDKLEYYNDYFWRVRLVVGTRVGLWSDIWKFKTGIQTADLLNPPDKSIEQPTTIKFKWYEVVGVKYYQLQISKNSAFTDLVYSTDSLDKAEQYVEDLEPEILYYWRVRAWNVESYGTSQWSNVWTFTTGKVTLVLRNPKTGSTGIPIPTFLSWFTATTAEYYHLQVAKDAGFTNVIFDKDSIYDTKWTLSKTDVETNTNYFWRAKGVSKQYTTPWSDIWQLKTGSVSVEESPLFSSIKLYPNPTGSKAELSINYTENCEAKILITTAEGKIIRTDAIRLLIGETRYGIDTEKLSSGSYYITIVTPSGYVTRELVVVK